MTPLHRVALETHACRWCGALPTVHYYHETGHATCRRCLDEGPPPMTTTAAPQTNFAIDIGPAIPEAQRYLDGATQGLARLDGLLASLPQTEAAEQQVSTAAAHWAAIDKQLDATRKSWRALVQPILDRIDGTYKPASAVCDLAIQRCKAWLLASQAARRAAVQQQLAAAVALSAANPEQARHEIVAATASVVRAPAGMRSVQRWSARVTNAAAVPRELCVPDQKTLDRLAVEYKGTVAPPPGVEWVMTESMERTGR